jgi:hypothetical protein
MVSMKHRVSFGIVDRSTRIHFVPRQQGNTVMTGIHVTMADRKKKKRSTNDTTGGMDTTEYDEDGFLANQIPPEGITSEDGTVNVRCLEQEEWDYMRHMYGDDYVWQAVRKRKQKQTANDQGPGDGHGQEQEAVGTSVDVEP